MRPVCVTCHIFMRCHKNGRAVEVLSDGEPYQIWHGDEWWCDECGAKIMVGFGREPLEEAFQPGYAPLKQAELDYGNLVTVEG